MGIIDWINEINQTENAQNIGNNNIHLNDNNYLEDRNNENNNPERTNRIGLIYHNHTNIFRINPQIHYNSNYIERREDNIEGNIDVNMEWNYIWWLNTCLHNKF